MTWWSPETWTCIITGSTVGDDVQGGQERLLRGSRSSHDRRRRRGSAQTVYLHHDGTTVGGRRRDQQDRPGPPVRQHRTAATSRSGAPRSRSTSAATRSAGASRSRTASRDILFGDPLTVGCAGNTVRNGRRQGREQRRDEELVIRGNTIYGRRHRGPSTEGPPTSSSRTTRAARARVQWQRAALHVGGNTGWNRKQASARCRPRSAVTSRPADAHGRPRGPGGSRERRLHHRRLDRRRRREGGQERVLRGVRQPIGGDIEGSSGLDGLPPRRHDRRRRHRASQDRPGVPVRQHAERRRRCVADHRRRSSLREPDRRRRPRSPTAVGTSCSAIRRRARTAPANTMPNGHSPKVEDNYTDVEFVIRGNTFRAATWGCSTTGAPSDKFVQNNTGGDELECFDNATRSRARRTGSRRRKDSAQRSDLSPEAATVSREGPHSVRAFLLPRTALDTAA